MNRYLDAAQVNKAGLSSNQRFAPPGHCDWCYAELPKGHPRFCARVEEDAWPWRESQCLAGFYNYWYKVAAFKRAVFIRDDFTCVRCGSRPSREDKPWLPQLSRLHCDHIVPLSRGGGTNMENLQTLCAACNLKKGSRTESEFGKVLRIEADKQTQTEMFQSEHPAGSGPDVDDA